LEAIHLLAVDDEPFNLDLIELAFMEVLDTVLEKAYNGAEALEKMRASPPDVVLLDLRMPGMDGFETFRHIREDEALRHIPVIVVTANSEEKHRALQMGANDFLAKPIDPEELKLRTLNQAELYRHKKHLDQLVDQRTKALSEALAFAKETEYEISLRLGRASEYRDLESGMHIRRMSHYSALLGKLTGMDEEEERLLLYASPLHDVGKIGIPDVILLKPGRLDEKEFAIMRQHTLIGAKILENAQRYPIIEAGRIIALQHHEKYDGSGYPNGLKGEAIHLYGRIVAIADVFDALTSKRVYKKAFSIDESLAIMQKGRGTHFDPELLDLFIDNLPKFLEIRDNFPDEEGTPPILQIMDGAS